MSKIGKINIPIPEKVKVLLSGNTINIEGPLGKQEIKLDLEMFELNITEGKDVSINPKKLDDNSNDFISNLDLDITNLYEKYCGSRGMGLR